MSAMIGTGLRYTSFVSASASSAFGTATRTISQPAEARSAICAIVASTSYVFVRVIDCTATGAPPPIATPPTWIWRSLAIAESLTGQRRGLTASDAVHVVREPDEEEEEDDDDADDGGALVGRARDRAPTHPLGEREGDVPAVERQEREEIEERERERDEGEDAQVLAEAGLERLAGGLHDADRA